MDNDISHAVEERLAAIEARLDELEGNGHKPKPTTLQDEELYVTEEDD